VPTVGICLFLWWLCALSFPIEKCISVSLTSRLLVSCRYAARLFIFYQLREHRNVQMYTEMSWKVIPRRPGKKN